MNLNELNEFNVSNVINAINATNTNAYAHEYEPEFIFIDDEDRQKNNEIKKIRNLLAIKEDEKYELLNKIKQLEELIIFEKNQNFELVNKIKQLENKLSAPFTNNTLPILTYTHDTNIKRIQYYDGKIYDITNGSVLRPQKRQVLYSVDGPFYTANHLLRYIISKYHTIRYLKELTLFHAIWKVMTFLYNESIEKTIMKSIPNNKNEYERFLTEMQKWNQLPQKESLLIFKFLHAITNDDINCTEFKKRTGSQYDEIIGSIELNIDQDIIDCFLNE